ncbi:MAG: hypothetical protein H8E21_17580 [Gammaproteobacteria bacterium]|nr:hypothetical protein [Gammaproteobacteria bacterium]
MNYFDEEEARSDLLEDAILAVNNKIGIHLELTDDYYNGGMNAEGRIYIEEFPHLRYFPKIRFSVQTEHMGVLANDVLRLPVKGMLVADYVTPGMAAKLRKLNVPFIDTAGNAYLNEKGIGVYSTNSKLPQNQQQKLVAHRRGIVLTPSGLKVVYALLRDSRLIKSPYKIIALWANVSIDMVRRVVKELIHHRYVFQENRNRFLVKKKELLDKWVKAYLEILRPRQCLGTFHLDSDFWDRKSLYTFEYYGARLSGETACMLEKRQEPKSLDFYLPEKSWQKFVSDSRLQPEESGRIKLYKAFWSEVYESRDSSCSVDPIIIYADLLARADAKSLRMARTVYQERLQAYIS